MTLLLNGTNGVSDVDGTAATPAIRGTDTNTGIFFPAADTIAFAEGGVAIIIPAPEYLVDHTIEEIAAKDVPTGKPFKIVDVSDIPEDRTFRNAWEYQE